MPNKILILSNSSSGLYDFRHELIEQLIADGNEIAATIPERDKAAELEAIGCRLIDCPIDRRGVNPVTDLKLMRRFARLIKAEKPKLVITYTIKPNIYGGLACRFAHVPYAANITGLGTAFQNSGLLRRIVTILYKIGLKKARTVFFENSDNMRTLQIYKIVKEKQCCLLNGAGVNLERFQAAPYPQNHDTTRFLFVGRVMKEKGVDELFTAMQRLVKNDVNCTLDVLGNYEEDYKEQIDQYAAAGWLKYHGYQMDVRPFIAQSDCFVLPSWHEGMANTNLECAAMARPLITSNIPGCKEAVIPDVSGFLAEPKNADSLYDTMLRFAQLDNNERAKMGEAGRQHMLDVFDKKKVVAATIAGLES